MIATPSVELRKSYTSEYGDIAEERVIHQNIVTYLPIVYLSQLAQMYIALVYSW
jgi:hypothetical protein